MIHPAVNKAIIRSQVIDDEQWSQIETKTSHYICQTTCTCILMLYIPRRLAKPTTSVQIQSISPWLFASDLFLEFCLTGQWWEIAEREWGATMEVGSGEGRRKDRQRSPLPPTSSPLPEGGGEAWHTHLFTCSHDFLQVIFRGESLHRC